MAEEQLIGKATHYFGNIGVAVLSLSGGLRVGDTVRLKGPKTDFTQRVESMQVDRQNIDDAKPGDDVALKVDEKVREGDDVFFVASS